MWAWSIWTLNEILITALCLDDSPYTWPSRLTSGLHCPSPWYNCTSWLGVKHQFTYCVARVFMQFQRVSSSVLVSLFSSVFYLHARCLSVTQHSLISLFQLKLCQIEALMQCALSITAFTQRNLLQMTDRTSTNKLIRLLPQVLSIHIVQNYFHAQIRLAPQILSIHIILNNLYAQRRLPLRFLSTHIIQNCLQQTHRTLMHKLVRHPPQILSIHIIQNWLWLTDMTFMHKLIRHRTPFSNSFYPLHTELLAADRQDFYAQINKT